MTRPNRSAAATLIGLLLLAGCSGGGGDADADAVVETPSSPAASTTATPFVVPTAAVPTPTPTPTLKAGAGCLFTVRQISRVLDGAWTRKPEAGPGCTYVSDRGAVVATSLVAQAVAPGLREAKKSCLPGIKPITFPGGGSVCVEHNKQVGDMVVGNTAAHGLLYLALIAPRSKAPYEAELTAMVGLVGEITP